MNDRIIKFRIWVKSEKKMYDWYNNEDIIKDAIPLDVGDEWTEDCELMEFTGFKDKNGKEIYEGDILKVICSKNPNIFTVSFSNGQFGSVFGWGLNRIDKTVQWNLTNEPKYYEIVGNIFENSELLNIKNGQLELL